MKGDKKVARIMVVKMRGPIKVVASRTIQVGGAYRESEDRALERLHEEREEREVVSCESEDSVVGRVPEEEEEIFHPRPTKGHWGLQGLGCRRVIQASLEEAAKKPWKSDKLRGKEHDVPRRVRIHRKVRCGRLYEERYRAEMPHLCAMDHDEYPRDAELTHDDVRKIVSAKGSEIFQVFTQETSLR